MAMNLFGGMNADSCQLEGESTRGEVNLTTGETLAN